VIDFVNSLTLPLIVGTLVASGLVLYTLRNLECRGAFPFLLALLAVLDWTVFYLLEIGSRSLEYKLIWANLQFLGIGALPVLWLFMILIITGREEIKKGVLLVSLPIPIITNILAWTNPWHHLFRSSPVLVTEGSLLLVKADYGAWHNWVFVPFQYILYGFTLVLILDAWTHAKQLYRRRYLLITLAILIPMIGSSLYIIGIPPFQNINPAPVLFGITCLIFAWAIFNYSLLDVVPLARDAVIENLKDAVLVFDSQTRLVDYNPSAAHLFPLINPRKIGKPAKLIFDAFGTLLHQVKTHTASSELNLSSADPETGEQHHYRSTLSFVQSHSGAVVGKILTIGDITTQVELLNRMQKLATTDSLTGILNRRSFFEQTRDEIDRAKRYKRSISFLLFDLDHFKKINDSHGHAAGDQVLVTLIGKIVDTIRKEDIFGRYGGEEFALCLPETTEETALQFAERLRAIIFETAIEYNGRTFHVTASFGVSGVSVVREESLEQMLVRVDHAMYTAKEAGRNCSRVFRE